MTMQRCNDIHLTATEPAADTRLYPFRGEENSLRRTSALLNLWPSESLLNHRPEFRIRLEDLTG